MISCIILVKEQKKNLKVHLFCFVGVQILEKLFEFGASLCFHRFGADVMEMVVSWTKGLCNDISRGHLLNHLDDAISEPPKQGEKDLSNWSVLDVGTGNGLLLQEFAKQG